MFRKCLASNVEAARALIESANKLDPVGCINNITTGISKVFEELKKNQDKYKECLKIGQDASSFQGFCIKSSAHLNDMIDKMTLLSCGMIFNKIFNFDK